MTDVTKDQFEVHALQATHKPSGAKIRWASTAGDDFDLAERGRIGEMLENGEEYNEGEVLAMGIELLCKERFSRKR